MAKKSSIASGESVTGDSGPAAAAIDPVPPPQPPSAAEAAAEPAAPVDDRPRGEAAQAACNALADEINALIAKKNRVTAELAQQIADKQNELYALAARINA